MTFQAVSPLRLLKVSKVIPLLESKHTFGKHTADQHQLRLVTVERNAFRGGTSADGFQPERGYYVRLQQLDDEPVALFPTLRCIRF